MVSFLHIAPRYGDSHCDCSMVIVVLQWPSQADPQECSSEVFPALADSALFYSGSTPHCPRWSKTYDVVTPKPEWWFCYGLGLWWNRSSAIGLTLTWGPL